MISLNTRLNTKIKSVLTNEVFKVVMRRESDLLGLDVEGLSCEDKNGVHLFLLKSKFSLFEVVKPIKPELSLSEIIQKNIDKHNKKILASQKEMLKYSADLKDIEEINKLKLNINNA